MTFADNYLLRSVQANFNQVASAVDKMLVTIASDINSGIINTTSATFVDYTGASASITTTTGQLLIIIAQIWLSHGTDAVKSEYTINFDSSNVATGAWTSSSADTGGQRDNSCLIYATTPSVAAHTIKIQWRTTSGTVYSANSAIYAFALQNS